MQRRCALGAAGPWKEVRIDRIRIAYDDVGDGPAILCLHAAGHGSSDFRPLATRLRRHFRVVAIDWPGHGNSECDRVAASSSRHAYLLARFIEAAGLDHPILVGHGMGADAALRFAAQEPSLARALVLVNPASILASSRRVRRRRKAMMHLFAAASRGSRWVMPILALHYRRLLRGKAVVAQRRRIVAAAAESAAMLLQAWQSLDSPDADLRDFGPYVTCPVLFAWATRDRFVPLGRALAGIGQFPHAKLVRFEAFAPHLEHPDAFAECLAWFARAPERCDRHDISRPNVRILRPQWAFERSAR